MLTTTLLVVVVYVVTLTLMVGVDLVTDGAFIAASFGKDSPRRLPTPTTTPRKDAS